ncbi:type VI secretion system baseplate subunit TssE [Cloacibacillus sp.]|uniref:type VI secretion system baseplate subunit TssE n=1 Tax=Cloacibacillus sp. TaxID=2049023 RepID=UPI0025C1E103|nr:type VI secretion system baseplate subunit TssE [Cloacibacillus sp.]MCC8058679.1 type VI secretion system baseplate subunit TssE [Cloacibacillus sp.]MCC8178145.1 type VI secretion system baseplate subunit TssE [Cloacibacillus sp.]
MSSIRFLERLRTMQHGPERGDFGDPAQVLRSVIDYVGKLLNTRRGSSVLDEAFGIPDFTSIGVNYSRDDMPRIEKEIAEFIERCEPRLRNVKAAYAPDPGEPFSVNFTLDAGLVLTGTETLPVKLMTRINPSGKVSVSG